MEKSISFSTYLAIASFAIGTLLLALHKLFPTEDYIVVIGLFYVVFATILNSIAFVNLLYQFIEIKREREAIAIRILILLTNIPIAVFYFFIVIKFNF